MNPILNPAQAMLSVVEFFDKVDKRNGGDGMVWAKATAPRGAQVIVEIRTANNTRVKIPPIKPGDPVCLSKYATFDVLRDAPDLLQCANNGLVRLLSHVEATAFFQRKADLLKTTPDSLIQKADNEARAAVTARPLDATQVDQSARIYAERPVDVEEAINPRLHTLAAQVSPLLKEGERLPVSTVMSELLDLEEALTMEDLEFVRSKMFYPSVKKWAEQKQHELAIASGIIPASDALSDE